LSGFRKRFARAPLGLKLRFALQKGSGYLLRMDILGQSALFVGLISFALGFSVLARNVKNKLFIAFAVLTSIIAAWAICFFLEKLWPGGTFYRWHLFFGLWLGPGALAFIRYMFRAPDRFPDRFNDRLSRRLLDFSVLLALVLTVVLVMHLEWLPGAMPAMVFMPVVVVIQMAQLMWIDRRLRRDLKRLPRLEAVGFFRRNLIYLGALSALLFSTMDHVPALGTALPSFGNFLLAAYLFFVSQAISQQRLLNFGALLSRMLVLTVVALTLAGVYSILVAWIQNSPGLFFLNSFIASFLILTLLEPLRKVVRYFTQRLLTQKHLRLEQTMREASLRLTGITDPSALFQNILLTAEQVIQPQFAALFLLRRDGTKYRRVRITGTEPLVGEGRPMPLRELLADHPLLETCVELHRKGELPVLFDQMIESEIDRSASRLQRERLTSQIQGLKALGCNLLIPMFDSGHVLGFVTLLANDPPESWGGNWGLLPVVYPYFEQAAQTLRSLAVFVRQREKERLAALGEMAAGLAHEIRNPLGAIKGAAQFLDPGPETSGLSPAGAGGATAGPERPDRHFLKIIVEEVDRLNRVVTQFLDYSKPFSPELQPVELTGLVAKTVETMRAALATQPLPPGAVAPALSFTGQIPAGRSIRVQGAPEQLQQVMINLIQNAAKALALKQPAPPHPSIRVSVELEGDVGPNRHADAIVSVEDNGTGIKKENLEKLFIPFFTTSPSGTGLGLSISQKIIEAHRGRIDVSTEEGRFTRFSVILPAIE
jgi:signal transduction histidine kinase